MTKAENFVHIFKRKEKVSQLPDELWKRIFEQLPAKEVYNCRKVSRQFARVIRENWLKLSRPFMHIYIRRPNSTHALQPKHTGGCCGALAEGGAQPEPTLPIPDHPKPNEWVINVHTSFLPSRACDRLKHINFKYIEGMLTVSVIETRNREHRAKRPRLLRVCKKFFKQLGYPGKLKTPVTRWFCACGDIEELRIPFASFEESLNACLRFCVSSQYRLEMSAGAGPWSSDDQLFDEIHKFLHQQPITLETMSLHGHTTQKGKELIVEAVQKYQGKVFKLRFDSPYCGDYIYYPHYWTVKLEEHNPKKEIEEAEIDFKTINENGFYARNMESEFHHTFDLMDLIDVAFMEVIRIDIWNVNKKMTADLMRLFVRQWLTGLRTIERITFRISAWLDDYRVDLMDVLKEFACIALPNFEDREERILVSKSDDNTDVLIVYRRKEPCQTNETAFYLVIEKEAMFEHS